MRGYAGGVLLIVAGVAFSVALFLAPPVNASAHDPEAMARRDFDGLVRAVGEHYHVHAKTVPMMGVVNLWVKVMTQGGVDGMRVAQFEDAAAIGRRDRADAETTGFAGLVRTRLGDGWTQIIREQREGGEESLVYEQNLAQNPVQGGGRSTPRMRLIVLDLDGRELDMVSLSLGPEELAKWVEEREHRGGWTREARAQAQAVPAGDRID
jgi:hypothetical protein